MRFGDTTMFWLLALVPVLVLFFVWAYRARRRVLERFAAGDLAYKLTASVSRPARLWKTILLVGVVLFAVLALTRPQWGFEWRQVKRRGVDVFVVLDVSKSMLAEDVRPNRLTQAKFAVEDLLGKLAGDRVGLIAFAGSVFVQCPLTVDDEAFRLTLRDLSPASIPRGGTAIGPALRVALKAFETGARGERVIVLITDGEATDGDPLPAVAEAKQQGVRIYVIGIGTSAGELIPVQEPNQPREFLKDREGRVVQSRLQEDTLRQIALGSNGIYVRSAAGDFGIETIYDKGIAQLRGAEHEARLQKRPLERYQWPLGIAVGLLMIQLLLTDRRKPVLLLALALGGWRTTAVAADGHWPQTYNDGVAAYRTNDFTGAARAFEQATASPDRALQARALYNLGNARYRQGQAAEQTGPPVALPVYEQALRGYESALAITPTDEDAKFNQALVKKKIDELKKQQEQQQQAEQKKDDQQPQSQPEQKPESKTEQPQQQQPEQQPQSRQTQQQPAREQPSAQSPTNEFSKTQARVLLDNLREDERNWNFFPELQQRAGEEKEPAQDW